MYIYIYIYIYSVNTFNSESSTNCILRQTVLRTERNPLQQTVRLVVHSFNQNLNQ